MKFNSQVTELFNLWFFVLIQNILMTEYLHFSLSVEMPRICLELYPCCQDYCFVKSSFPYCIDFHLNRCRANFK
jgi:hypothetical protein